MPSSGFTHRVLFLTAVLSLALVALWLVLLGSAGGPASAQDDTGTERPAKPTGLGVETQRGSLTASVDWDDVAGADKYWVRWRPKSGNLNAGVEVQSSATDITVSDYGRGGAGESLQRRRLRGTGGPAFQGGTGPYGDAGAYS